MTNSGNHYHAFSGAIFDAPSAGELRATTGDAPGADDIAALPSTDHRKVAEDAEIFRRLRNLKKELRRGGNKHEQVIVLISACIAEGFDTRARIVGALRQLDFDRGHVMKLLSLGTGGNPERHHWKADANGRYHVHDELEGSTDG